MPSDQRWKGAGHPIPDHVPLVDPHRLLHRETRLLIPVEASDIDVRLCFFFFKQLWNVFVVIWISSHATFIKN